jgi:hypothetical protein
LHDFSNRKAQIIDDCDNIDNGENIDREDNIDTKNQKLQNKKNALDKKNCIMAYNVNRLHSKKDLYSDATGGFSRKKYQYLNDFFHKKIEIMLKSTSSASVRPEVLKVLYIVGCTKNLHCLIINFKNITKIKFDKFQNFRTILELQKFFLKKNYHFLFKQDEN